MELDASRKGGIGGQSSVQKVETNGITENSYPIIITSETNADKPGRNSDEKPSRGTPAKLSPLTLHQKGLKHYNISAGHKIKKNIISVMSLQTPDKRSNCPDDAYCTIPRF